MFDIGWLIKRSEELARIGRLESGGISRPALSDLETRAKAFVASLMEEMGMSVRYDAATNLFGRIGAPHLPMVMTGSHVDTVPRGGAYDGALGVLAALAVVRSLDLGSLPAALEVAVFAGEESSRFGLSVFGSRAFASGYEIERLSRHSDAEGIGLIDALEQLGTDPRILKKPTMLQTPYAFLELHIEQGTMLIDAQKPVGVVTAIAAPTRLDAIISGRASHSGATLPKDRKDALVAAAEVIAGIEALMKREERWQSVATVGRIRVSPNVINVVPGQAELGIDIRGSDPGSKRRLVRAIDKLLAKVAGRRGLQVSRRAVVDEEPVQMDPNVVDIVRQSARHTAVEFSDIVSMAGHDAMEIARVCPTAMVFIRNVSGVSHTPEEMVDEADIARGCAVLRESVLRLLQEAAVKASTSRSR